MHTNSTRFFAALRAANGLPARGLPAEPSTAGAAPSAPAFGTATPETELRGASAGEAFGRTADDGPRGPSNRWRVPLRPPLASFGSPPFGTIRVYFSTLLRS